MLKGQRNQHNKFKMSIFISVGENAHVPCNVSHLRTEEFWNYKVTLRSLYKDTINLPQTDEYFLLFNVGYESQMNTGMQLSKLGKKHSG